MAEEEVKGEGKDYSKEFLDSMQGAGKGGYTLEDYRVEGTQSAYYICDYLDRDQEEKLLECTFRLDQERWYEMKSGR